ncbi:MAG: type II toxin-antitoxin system HicA family toxin [Planctomycetes bacterium]|nr:type II toxin-antitoxin system HicA family toxin [Planctomycetota bacterium]
MTYRELTRKLRRLGCEFVRHAAGSHEIWWRPAIGGSRRSPDVGEVSAYMARDSG